ncbi:MAG TPA: hypothetical protein PK602_00125, partial [Methanothrix sp.]|nr:hypothetical protein [Methanothrix sp.]
EVYYSEFAEHIYSRPREYNVTLMVEDDKGATGSFSQLIEVKEINDKPVLISLQPDIKSPQEIGTVVAWTAVASDAESDPMQYQFFLDGLAMHNWSDISSWVWNADRAGIHVVEAKVRDGKHDANGDSFRSSAFEIVSHLNNAPVLNSLVPDKDSPQETGTFITWIASANDDENDPLEFQFSLVGPMCTEVIQDWSSSPTFSWSANTTCSGFGNHDIEARVRDGKHDPNGDSSITSVFEIIKPPRIDILNPESIVIASNESNTKANSSRKYIIKNITINASEDSEKAKRIIEDLIKDDIFGDLINGALKESFNYL